MNPSRGVLDTSTLILLGRIQDPSRLPDESEIAAVTLAELSVGPLVAATDADRSARQSHLQLAESDFDALPFDTDAARAFGRVAASLRRAGRKPAARAYDAMIAATAIANGLAVYTCNPDDFAAMRGWQAHDEPSPSHDLALPGLDRSAEPALLSSGEVGEQRTGGMATGGHGGQSKLWPSLRHDRPLCTLSPKSHPQGGEPLPNVTTRLPYEAPCLQRVGGTDATGKVTMSGPEIYDGDGMIQVGSS